MIDIKDAQEIWKAYDLGREYKSGIDLYDIVERNEAFYVGDQWRGLDAPNIPKPVLNLLKRTVSMLVAKVCSDDLAANIQPFIHTQDDEDRVKMMGREVDKVMELTDIKQLGKIAVRNAAVDGDACVYTWWDGDAPTGQDSKGAIRAELVENINVIFENPHCTDVQGQRYIIIARRLPVGEVKDRAKSNGVSANDIEQIVPDDDSHQGEQGNDNKLVTLLTLLYREDETIHAVESTEKVIVRKEWDTELKRYPLAWLTWEKQRNSMHGRAAITDMIPNQIAINKAYAGLLYEIERIGFHTLIVNRQYIKNWDGSPGRVLKVEGNPDVRQVAAYIDGAQANPGISSVIGEIISYTRDFMGTNDASAGNVRPDNASAIIALQNADTIPLELTRQTYNTFIEAIVRNLVDMMSAYYGTREVETQVTNELGEVEDAVTMFDFSGLADENQRVSVDIGAASMWSEITQMDALNALFTSGIMDDPRKMKLYLEIVPDKYVPGKAKLLAWCDEMEAQMQPMTEPYGEQPMEYNYAPTIAQEGIYQNV